MKPLHEIRYEHENHSFMIAKIIKKRSKGLSKVGEGGSLYVPHTLKNMQNIFDDPPNYLRILRERAKSNNYNYYVSAFSLDDGYGCRVSTRLRKLSIVKKIPEYNLTISEIAEICMTTNDYKKYLKEKN